MTETKNILLGRHFIAELSGCSGADIAMVIQVEAPFLNALKKNGATILGEHAHQFEPEGATVVAILSESHASLHTWPEHGAVCIDIFTCSETLNAEAAISEISDVLGATHCELTVLDRAVTNRMGQSET